jgi:hypothetical protein
MACAYPNATTGGFGPVLLLRSHIRQLTRRMEKKLLIVNLPVIFDENLNLTIENIQGCIVAI